MTNRKTAFFFLLLILYPLTSFPQDYNETILITTYYPSPYGEYQAVRLNPRSNPGTPCNEGEFFYDNDASSNGLRFCNNAGQWTTLSAGGYWAENATNRNIYNVNTGGLVGIGTQSPLAPLTVNGGALGSGPGNTVALYELGSDVSTNQYLQTITQRKAMGGNTWNSVELYLRRNVNVFPANKGFIIWPGGSAGIGFGSGTNEYMRLRGTGEVGIGTVTSPDSLRVVGDIGASGNITVTGDVCNGAGKCLHDIP